MPESGPQSSNTFQGLLKKGGNQIPDRVEKQPMFVKLEAYR